MSYAYLSSTPGLKFNYSLFAIPAAWVVAMGPIWWAAGAAKAASEGAYNNAYPGDSWASLDKKGLEPALYKRIKNAVAANVNGHTNLGIFAASLAAANAAHVDSDSLHLYSASFLVCRVAYNFAYILIDDENWSYLRSTLYLGGVASCFTLVVKAANQYKSMPW